MLLVAEGIEGVIPYLKASDVRNDLYFARPGSLWNLSERQFASTREGLMARMESIRESRTGQQRLFASE